MCAIGGPFCRMRCTRTSRTLYGFCLSLGIESLLFEYQKNLHRVIVKSNIPIFIIWRPTFPHQGWPNCHLRREERNTDGNCAWSGKRRVADHLCRVHGDSRQHQTHPAVKVDAKRWTEDKDKDRVWELAQLVVRRIGESFLTLPFLFTYWSTSLSLFQGEQHKCAWEWDSPTVCCVRGQRGFCCSSPQIWVTSISLISYW